MVEIIMEIVIVKIMIMKWLLIIKNQLFIKIKKKLKEKVSQKIKIIIKKLNKK